MKLKSKSNFRSKLLRIKLKGWNWNLSKLRGLSNLLFSLLKANKETNLMLILQKWHKNFLQKEEILIVRLGCLETQKKKKRRTHLSPSISTKMRSFAFMFFRHFVYMPNLSTRPYTAWLQGVSNHTRTIFSPSWRISFRTDWPVNNMHMCQSCLS